MKKVKNRLTWIKLFLITLWVYAAVSKLLEVEVFAAQLERQPLPFWLASHLVWALPVAELLVAGLLVFRRFELAGLWFSLGLMLLFTGYVALAVWGVWQDLPCACGGVLSQLGWQEHLVFNLLFTVLAGYGLSLCMKRKGRGEVGRASSSGAAAYRSGGR
ncbi:MauE/DoxX family redox-associated membrane protein [Pontibacter korlensis]|uniref:MauE/DoxX family redox-associated membrane protein n=1 Tax=Pontibacter korlensis TaxID=400092 RepID=UPI0006970F05|nr:MauE/DoxX family redox-associated membrane protein [Pontibacter korlensis]